MLRGFHCSECVVVFHFVYWMSSLFLGGVGFVCFGACLCFAFRRLPAFCISPVLLQPENS